MKGRSARRWFVLVALLSGCGGGNAQREPDSGAATTAEASAPKEAGTGVEDAAVLSDSAAMVDAPFETESGSAFDAGLESGLDAALDATLDGKAATAACDDNAAAYCAHLQLCSQTDLQILYGDLGTCVEQQTANCQAALAAPATGDNPSNVEACSQAYAGWACTDFLDDIHVPAPCRQAQGTIPYGDSCAFGSQCASGLCAIPAGSACGLCGRQPLPGDGCGDQFQCFESLICSTAECVPLGTSGAPCDGHHPCGSGSSCVGGEALFGAIGSCQAPVAEAGASCDPTQQTGPGCDANLGLICDSTTQQCDFVTGAPGGRPCNVVGNEITPCGAAGQCAAIGPAVVGIPPTTPPTGFPIPINFGLGTCSPAAPVGAPCDTSQGPPCIAGSRCISPSFSSTAGTCQIANAAVCNPPVLLDAGVDASGRNLEMRPITEFPAPAPGQLALGPDNNVWYATGDTSIGRITPTGVVTVFEIAFGAQISSVAAGVDGRIWWLNRDAAESIGSMALDGTGIESQALPSQHSGPAGLTAGPGSMMWFTQAGSRQIGNVTSAWAFTEFSLDGQIPGAFDIVAGPDGNLWFSTSWNSICQVTPAGVPTCFSVPSPPNTTSQMVLTQEIAVGPDGNLWFTASVPNADGATIGRMTTAGAVTLFPLPDARSAPTGITAGPDGNLWFCESAADYVGRITPSGDITEFRIPTAGAQMSSIVAGGDGKIWFSEPEVDKIGTIAP